MKSFCKWQIADHSSFPLGNATSSGKKPTMDWPVGMLEARYAGTKNACKLRKNSSRFASRWSCKMLLISHICPCQKQVIKSLRKWGVIFSCWVFAPCKRLDILQPYEEVEEGNIGDMEKVTGALKGCRQITSLLERCKESSWRPTLWLKEHEKFGDYNH